MLSWLSDLPAIAVANSLMIIMMHASLCLSTHCFRVIQRHIRHAMHSRLPTP